MPMNWPNAIATSSAVLFLIATKNDSLLKWQRTCTMYRNRSFSKSDISARSICDGTSDPAQHMLQAYKHMIKQATSKNGLQFALILLHGCAGLLADRAAVHEFLDQSFGNGEPMLLDALECCERSNMPRFCCVKVLDNRLNFRRLRQFAQFFQLVIALRAIVEFSSSAKTRTP
jgi:hypothetical protein